MRSLQIVFVIAVAFVAYKAWSGHREQQRFEAAKDGAGFVSVAMPSDASPGTVVILAPQNCPSAAAQRARTLAQELTHRGIPNQISSHYAASIESPTEEDLVLLRRAATVLNGEIPAVFVKGRAKSNPTADEVASEYGVPD